jgi:hypothetical protein
MDIFHQLILFAELFKRFKKYAISPFIKYGLPSFYKEAVTQAAAVIDGSITMEQYIQYLLTLDSIPSSINRLDLAAWILLVEIRNTFSHFNSESSQEQKNLMNHCLLMMTLPHVREEMEYMVTFMSQIKLE